MEKIEINTFAGRMGKKVLAYLVESVPTGRTWLHDVLNGTTTPYNSLDEAKAAAERDDLGVEEVDFATMPSHVQTSFGNAFVAQAREAVAIAEQWFHADISVFGGNHISGNVSGGSFQTGTVHGGINLRGAWQE